MTDDLRARAREVLDEPCLNGLSASDQLSDEDTMVLEARLASALRAAVAAERERIAKWHDAQAEDNLNQWRQGRPDEMRPYAEAAATHTASAAAIRGDKP